MKLGKDLLLGMGSFVLATLVASHGIARGMKEAGTTSTEVPASLQGVGIVEHIGQKLDLKLPFVDETGKQVVLGDYFQSGRPVLLSLVYFSCPGLCNLHLNGLVDGLKDVPWSAGQEFEMLSISFDSNEKFEVAAKKKESYLKKYPRPTAQAGWHFLTADDASIRALTESVGFSFKWDKGSQEWAHASAAILISPTGVVTRYLPGVFFEPQTLKLGLNESADGKLGTLTDKLFLTCFQYDPHQSKYTIYAFRLVQMGGGLMILILCIWLFFTWLRSRSQRSASM
jgi:protein SCO1/2